MLFIQNLKLKQGLEGEFLSHIPAATFLWESPGPGSSKPRLALTQG